MEVEDGAGPEEVKQNLYFQRRTSQNTRPNKPEIMLQVEESKTIKNTYQTKDQQLNFLQAVDEEIHYSTDRDKSVFKSYGTGNMTMVRNDSAGQSSHSKDQARSPQSTTSPI